jgi:hypothetical protein
LADFFSQKRDDYEQEGNLGSIVLFYWEVLKTVSRKKIRQLGLTCNLVLIDLGKNFNKWLRDELFRYF